MWSHFNFNCMWRKLKTKKTLIPSYISPECADISFQVARGRLKGNFIVHNFASPSHFRRRLLAGFKEGDQQWKIWWSRHYWFLFLLLPRSPSTWWNILKIDRFFTGDIQDIFFCDFSFFPFIFLWKLLSVKLNFFVTKTFSIDTHCLYGRNMQKLWCVQHKNIKGITRGLHMG